MMELRDLKAFMFIRIQTDLLYKLMELVCKMDMTIEGKHIQYLKVG